MPWSPRSERPVMSLAPMLDEYYREQDWTEDGIPTEKRLASLGLSRGDRAGEVFCARRGEVRVEHEPVLEEVLPKGPEARILDPVPHFEAELRHTFPAVRVGVREGLAQFR